MKRLISLVLCVLMVLALYEPALASDITIRWTGNAGDGKWHTSGNWDQERIPQIGDYVEIPDGAVVVCDLEGEDGPNVRLFCSGELEVASGTFNLAIGTSMMTKGKLHGAGDIVINPAGIDDPFVWVDGSIEGPGDLKVYQTTLQVSKSPASLDRHLVLYGLNARVLFADSLTLTRGAEAQNAGNNTISIHSGQMLTLAGDETSYNLSNCNNSGTLRISNTCSQVVFNYGFLNQHSGTLEFDIGGPSDFTPLQVGSSQYGANLNGTLKLNFLDGYVPSDGDSFDLITYNSRSNKFSSIVCNVDGITFDVVYASDRLTVTVRGTITTPSAPQNLTAEPGDGQVTISWDPPEESGGSDITKYQVKKSTDSEWIDVTSGTSYTFTGLTNGTEYTFIVRAVNEMGAGAEASITATPSPEITPPSAPQNFTATRGDGWVELTWTAPEDDGGADIDEYHVSKDGGNTWVTGITGTTYTFTELTNGVEYTFKVRAVNGVGPGEEATVRATPQAVPVPTHTVNFYSNGVLYATKTVTSGSSLGANWPANPTRSGFSFAGWFTGQNGTGSQYTSTTPITADVDLYAKWIPIPGSSEEPSDEPSVPPTQTYRADVRSGSGAVKTLPVTVDMNAGTASVDAGSQDLDQQGTTITMPSVGGVDTYSVGIPVSRLSTPDLQGTHTVNTGLGNVTIPSNMLTGAQGVDGAKAHISIGEGDKSTLPDDVKAAIGDRPLIQLMLTIDGKQTDWSNPSAPVTVSIPYTPTAEELANPEGIVVWYIDGSGNVVTIPNGCYDPATGMVTFSTTHFSDFAVTYNPVSFGDVPVGAWYHKAVSFIASRGITSGTGNGNYSPEAKLTRGDFIVLLMRAYGILPDTNPTDNFSDAGDTYYTGYLAAAKRLGISAGVGNNMYAPGKEITRQEMFTLLYNTLKVIGRLPQGDSGKALADFSDASEIAPWAEEAMAYLVRTGVVVGSDGRLTPARTTTRAEMAQVLYNLLVK